MVMLHPISVEKVLGRSAEGNRDEPSPENKNG